jgi:hypothetical protein
MLARHLPRRGFRPLRLMAKSNLVQPCAVLFGVSRARCGQAKVRLLPRGVRRASFEGPAFVGSAPFVWPECLAAATTACRRHDTTRQCPLSTVLQTPGRAANKVPVSVGEYEEMRAIQREFRHDLAKQRATTCRWA